MCNFYIMYYKEVSTQIPFPQCVGNNVPSLITNLPPGSDVQLPYNATLEAAAHGHRSHMQGHEDSDVAPNTIDKPTDGSKPGLQHYVNFQSDFMSDKAMSSSSVSGLDYPIGQVGGVATDNKGGVYVFHRGNRVWDGRYIQSFVYFLT
ncbi:peptidyl-glycine alpha-amidating monooxygenase B-like isoform X2 [Mizuhopecten yessoensis]|uniref:peptidyl-glycine alpha-amidating monooxygenase B-like isoform X2 n=1 Tax=Mizuhopecten yessoensis TaxID=6573 RepID=UPI000B45A5CA|nr:peptidyl-glycine alpha-amidating monooxygenase B-like isoform X2 [Mizuhopecten yessoensis]